MKRLKKSFFRSIRYYLNVLMITSDIDELCITRDYVEDISKTMWAHGAITYNTLKNIRALTIAIANNRILK